VRSGQPDAGRGVQSVVLAQIDGEPVGFEQLSDPCDSRLERVRERQLADCLAYDGQEGARPLELERNCPSLEARALSVCGAHAECRKRGKSDVGRFAVGRKQKLKSADRRLPQLERRGQRCLSR
jgi:hypothetical protein